MDYGVLKEIDKLIQSSFQTSKHRTQSEMILLMPKHSNDNISGLKPGNGFRCQIAECDGEEFQFGDFSDSLFPRRKDGSLDYCSYYQPRVEYNLETGLSSCSKTQFDQSKVVTCSSQATFVYNDFEFEETLATEWDSVCGVRQEEVFILRF